MTKINRIKVRKFTPAALAGVFILLLASGCIPGQTTASPSATAPASVPQATPGPTHTSTTAPAEIVPPQPEAAASSTPVKVALPTVLRELSSLPDPASAQWVRLPGALAQPVGIASPADGSGRVFVLEQAGHIRVFENGSLSAAVYLDISGQVGSNGSERGLLGLAFHPRFAENGYFYVNYTDLNGNTVISRFQEGAGNTADPASEMVLLQVDQPFPNHNGGSTVFGPDGYLYLGLGDGGSGGDPQGNGQSVDTLLGKILRIDVDNGSPYEVPSDNPFASGGGNPEIWAYGLRNPWRFSFDRATGAIYIGDVGQNAWEEIDYLPEGSPGGANFGWNIREGMHDYAGGGAGTPLVEPVWEYSHSEGCSVTGGVVYRGQTLPDWQGVYLFGDYCTGLVWRLARLGGNWQAGPPQQTGLNISSFGEDESGEVYLTDLNGGLYRLEPSG